MPDQPADNYIYGGPQPHAATQVGGDTFGYNPDGAMVSRTVDAATQQLSYDRHHRRARVVGPGGADWDMAYDGDGNRVAVAGDHRPGEPGPEVATYYIGNYEYDPDSGETVHYRLGGRRVGHRVGGSLKIVVTDLVGSTSAVIDGDTGDVDRLRYLPYGLPRGTGGHPDVGSDRLYTGQRSDDLGLMFYQARYYDPHIGRFAQPDTIVPDPTDPQDLNRYTYAANNPIRYSDPTAHYITEGTGYEPPPQEDDPNYEDPVYTPPPEDDHEQSLPAWVPEEPHDPGSEDAVGSTDTDSAVDLMSPRLRRRG